MLNSLILMSMAFVGHISVQSFSQTCNNDSTKPPNLKEQHLHWVRDTELHPSFQLLPDIFRAIGLQDDYARPMKGNIACSFGNRHCTGKSKRGSENINDISLCPYYFLLNYDSERYPPELNTARCRCDSVQQQSSQRKKGRSRKKCKRRCEKRHSEDSYTAPKCTEIPYKYKVLKQKYDTEGNKLCDAGNNFIYVRTYETVGIACTPVYPKSDIVSSNTKVVSGN